MLKIKTRARRLFSHDVILVITNESVQIQLEMHPIYTGENNYLCVYMYAYLITYITGILGIWKAVPVGLAFQLNPVMIWLMTTLGAVTGVLVLFFFGNRIRRMTSKRRKKMKSPKKEARANRLFEKYGTAGLGFLGCLLMGPNMTIIIGLVIVKSQKQLLYWTLVGIVAWTLVLTLTGVFSIELFNKVRTVF